MKQYSAVFGLPVEAIEAPKDLGMKKAPYAAMAELKPSTGADSFGGNITAII